METVQLKKRTGEDVVPVTAEPPQAFIDMWNEACRLNVRGVNKVYGRYNKDTGLFELNGITDITYEEAKRIFAQRLDSAVYSYNSAYRGYLERTNLLTRSNNYNKTVETAESMFYSSNVEVAQLATNEDEIINFRNVAYMFVSCAKLRKIIGKIKITTNMNNYFINQPPLLEEVTLHALAHSIDMQGSPKITYGSFKYLADNSANTAPINVTVHADIYKALTGGAEYPFNGGSREQWEALMSEAIGKQIAFVSA